MSEVNFPTASLPLPPAELEQSDPAVDSYLRKLVKEIESILRDRQNISLDTYVDPLTTKGDIVGYSTQTARVPIGSNDQILIADSTQALGLKWAANNFTPSASNALAGSVVKVARTQTGSVATGTTTIPLDDTAPQNTEGNEYMTLAITPTNASNTLLITITLLWSTSSGGTGTVALFQDSTASALAVGSTRQDNTGQLTCTTFSHSMVAGTTSSTTFKVRASVSAGTMTVNGASGARLFGGLAASSITIFEIKV